MPLKSIIRKETPAVKKAVATYSSVKTAESKQELHAAEIRKEVAIAGLRELELAEKNGSLVLVEDVAAAWADQCAMIKNGMMAIPDRLAPRLQKLKSARQIRNLLMEEISQVLNNLAEDSTRKAA